MRTLHLPLKEKWYRMIESGEKKEEYREINPYWAKRLLNSYFDFVGLYEMAFIRKMKPLDFTHAHFTLGYPKADDTSRNMTKEIKEIFIGKGNPEWGATEGKDYFVIRLK